MTTLRLLALIPTMAGSLLVIAGAPPAQPAKKFADIDIHRFQEMAGQPDTVILDVRTAEEYAAGHLIGAVLIDVRDPVFSAKIALLDKRKTYLVHCRSGVRSVTACNAMAELGMPKLYNLLGGIRAWQAAGMPLEK